MDILHIGSNKNELVYFETDKLSLTIKGSAKHPKFNSVITNELVSKISFSCKDNFDTVINNGNIIYDDNVQFNSNYIYSAKVKTLPIFYEQQNYELIIECCGNYIPEFFHDNINIRNKVSSVGRNNKILTGILNFGNEIGFTDLYVKINGKQYLNITIEIFPSKIQYQEDYMNLMSDVSDEIYNLAFDFMKKTYQTASINNFNKNSPTEFFSIIKILYENFIKACDIIINRPQHVLEVTYGILPSHKIKKVNQNTFRWLEKHPQYLKRNEINASFSYSVERALSVQKQNTYDVIENRFVKYVLNNIIKKLKFIRINYTNLKREQDNSVINQIYAMISGINRRLSFSFLSQVSDFGLSTSMSLVFAIAPGYRELYRYYLMLMRGLSINGDVFKISMKDLSVLYEYWCFIKINSLLRNKYKLIKQDILKVDKQGMFVSLLKGKNSNVIYKNPHNGELIEISYNPLSVNIPTVSQRPDNILSISKRRSKNKYKYIFDAKYRINPAAEGSRYKLTYNTSGPEEDDINTMHRYRDALVYEGSTRPDFERTMFGAYVLFPYSNEEEYINHQFYKSIDKVNIGGLPFLPSTTTLVSTMLEDLINESPESAFERATLPIGISEKLNNIDFKVRDVMVGTVGSKEQFYVNIEKNFYHVPVKYIPNYRFPIRYIALYQSNNIFGKNNCGIKFYGEVTRYDIIERCKIKEIPSKRDPNSLYYRFEIKEWKSLKQSIIPREFGPNVTMFTNMYLLNNSEFVTELYISSEEEYRIYFELKRLSNSIEIKEDGEKFKGFEYNGSNVIFTENEIKVYSADGRLTIYSVKEFCKRPRTILNKIKKHIILN